MLRFEGLLFLLGLRTLSSLCYTDVEEVLFPLTYNETGIDLGIKDFIVLSNGEKVENPKYLKKSIEKLKKL